MTVAGSRRKRQDTLLSRTASIFQHYQAILATAAIAIYGVVRIALDGFYSRFHLVAEDVGLSQTGILTRAVLYLVFFTLGLTLVCSLWWLVWWFGEMIFCRFSRRGKPNWHVAGRQGPEVSEPRIAILLIPALVVPLLINFSAPGIIGFAMHAPDRAFLSALLVMSLTIVPLWLAGTSLTRPTPTHPKLALLVRFIGVAIVTFPLITAVLLFPPEDRVYGTAAFTSFRIPALERYRTEEWGEMFKTSEGLCVAIACWSVCLVMITLLSRKVGYTAANVTGSRTQLRITLLATTTGVVLCVMSLAWKDGQAYAGDAMAGQAFAPDRFAIFSLKAVPVCVSSVKGRQAIDGPVLMLGQSDQRLILYKLGAIGSSEDGHVVRIPESGQVVYILEHELVSAEQRRLARRECLRFTEEMASLSKPRESD